MFSVEKNADGYYASVLPLSQPMLEPNAGTPVYVTDGFKAEFDFLLTTERGAVNLYFIGADHKTNFASVFEMAGDGVLYSKGWNPACFSRYSDYPAKLQLSAWHHFEAYYNDGEIKCYVDDYLLSTISNCKYVPVSILTMPRGPVMMRKWRLAKGQYAKDKVAKPYTPKQVDTKLFTQLPAEKKIAEKKNTPTSNQTKLFNQLPVENKVAVEKKKVPESNETKLFDKLPEEPKTQPIPKKVATGTETKLFDKLPEEDKPISRLSTEKNLVSHSVHFKVNDMTVMPESLPYIDELAKFLKENASIKLEIDGHTDSDGGEVYNRNLSQARADEVKRQLVTAGVASTRMTTKGLGASKPLKPNTTAKGKAENRRVEFIKQ